MQADSRLLNGPDGGEARLLTQRARVGHPRPVHEASESTAQVLGRDDCLSTSFQPWDNNLLYSSHCQA